MVDFSGCRVSFYIPLYTFPSKDKTLGIYLFNRDTKKSINN